MPVADTSPVMGSGYELASVMNVAGPLQLVAITANGGGPSTLGSHNKFSRESLFCYYICKIKLLYSVDTIET